MKRFSELGIKADESKKLIGDKIKVDKILNKEIAVLDYKVEDSKHNAGKCLYLQILVGDTKRVIFTGSKKLIELMLKTNSEQIPFTTTIVKEDDDSYNFT